MSSRAENGGNKRSRNRAEAHIVPSDCAIFTIWQKLNRARLIAHLYNRARLYNPERYYVFPLLLSLKARSPAVNPLNVLADLLYNAASFIAHPFTVDSEEVKLSIPHVTRDTLACGGTRDDVWRFMRKLNQYTVDDDGVRSIFDEGACKALVTELMHSFSAQVRKISNTIQSVSQ
jgi:hypothetical protein